MPPLNNRRGGPSGYTAEQPEALPGKVPGRVQGANPFIRCPLPPFNASPDTLRQFEENGKVPARRVIPLPIQTQVSGNVTVVNNTTVTPSTGGSSSSSDVDAINVATVTLNCPTMNPGDIVESTLVVAKVAALLVMTASDLCEVRIYGDPSTQAVDASRGTDNAPLYEVTPGLVSDVVFDTPPLLWPWQNRLFVNQDSPATTNLYITVLNPTGSTVTPSVTLTYLPLE